MTWRLSASVPSRSRNSAHRRCSSCDIAQRQPLAGGDGARSLTALEFHDIARMLAARLLAGTQDIEVLSFLKHLARPDVARRLQTTLGKLGKLILLRKHALDPVAECLLGQAHLAHQRFEFRRRDRKGV